MSELIKHFGLDWKLLLAQVVNFVILLVVLKKFAYGPIMRMLRLRREEIEKGFRASKESQERLGQIEELKEETLQRARAEALKVVSQAEELGKKRKQEIAVGAIKKGEALIAEAKRTIKEEKAKMAEEVYENAQELVRLGLERVLGRMAAKERDEVLIKEALRELHGLK